MGRGKGAKSKITGRISGYETADFSIIDTPIDIPVKTQNTEKSPYAYNSKSKMSTIKKVAIALGCIVIFLVIVANLHSKDNDPWTSAYVEPKVMTPESASVKPTAFTQRQLDAQKERDQKIGDLLKDGWVISDNIVPSNDYVTVGKKWDSISTNQSPVISITTSYEYDPKDQKFEHSSITLKLQEPKENTGITLDSNVTNILSIYNSQINIDTINSSVQAAYNATLSSKPYQGSLTFDDDYVYIDSYKSGRLINVTIEVNTSVSNN